ncbi:alpha/beta hydrolase [Pelagibacterium sediminicola]|uniref:alpha/beta hydrolase n=1 Tax=Pelagibacterium sediminicola TaxID=2248761 RepID=UPI001FE450D6|nr:hypothetical protein [Pelagibacterium sediminicola]
MAEHGFITLTFGGESGGGPRRISSLEIFADCFSATVDFLGIQPEVDRNKIGVIGVCGSGGFSLVAAEIDPRIKTLAAIMTLPLGARCLVPAFGGAD